MPARNPELRAAIRASVEKHKPFVSRPVLRRIALSVVAHWIGSQDGTLPAAQAMATAQEEIHFINTQFKARTTTS
jgi:hypothetical protein